MLSVEESVKPSGAECPRIVSAVLKALRVEDESPGAVDLMRAHVAHCPACAARLSRLGALIQAVTAEPREPDPGVEPEPPAAPSTTRRRHRRLPTNEAVNLVFEDGSVTLARMIEVSAKGARIESPDELEVDQNFTLNRGRRSTHVAVRHCTRQGELFIVGVEYMRQSVSV